MLETERLLDDADPGMLTAYCTAYGRCWRAHQQVRDTGGEVVKSPNGFPIQNPWLSIFNAAHKQVLQLSTEFGISPAARSRL
ncbi:MAG TPA: phage terminase small subunit P27 family, partial [Pirellulales bacterium]|nr:phage terminase small subunit P27 family [Pirellulales bacterium]